MRIKFPDRKLRIQPVFTIALLLCLSATTSAQEYGFDVWTTANGLPQNTVTGLVQTPDGYLWLSTFDGLARFDGVRFTIFDKGNTKGIVNNRFSLLFIDREGVIYAFTEDSVLTVYRNGSFVSYTQLAASSERVFGLVIDAKGNPVIETEKAYYSLRGDRLVPTPEKKEPNLKQIYWGKSGAKWVIEQNQITRQKDEQVTTYPLKFVASEFSSAASLSYEDRHGALWIRRNPASELWRLQDGKVTVFTKKEIPAFNELYPAQIMEDADGSTWFLFSGQAVPKPNQFVRFKDNHFTSYELNEAIGPTGSLVDREGNFWLATSTGLRRLRRKLIATLSIKDGLISNEVYPLIQTASGEIFIGTIQGVNRFADGKLTNLGLAYSTKDPLYLRGLWEDDQKRLWLGYQGEGGFGRFEEPASLRRVGKGDFPNGATDFASDREGNIWVATDEGLFKYKDDQEIAGMDYPVVG